MNRITVIALLLLLALSAPACERTDASVATGKTVLAAQPVETEGTDATAQASTATSSVALGADASAQASSDAGDSSGETADGAAYTVTQTSYSSATMTASIRMVTTGTGREAVTYYVADVTLAEGTDLQSAFSSGEYGGREQDTSDIALANDAVVAINGDYYSSRDDGIIIRNGTIYRDVPARTGLTIYRDGTMQVYDETEVSTERLLADGAWNTYSFGPALLEDGALVEGIDTYEADVNPRHGIQGTNPRTGIGLIDAGHFVFVVVDGRNAGYSRGVSLTEFAQIFAELGCTTAYNLDGGGSSTMYFMGDVVNQPSQRQGERSVSDILFVG